MDNNRNVKPLFVKLAEKYKNLSYSELMAMTLMIKYKLGGKNAKKQQ